MKRITIIMEIEPLEGTSEEKIKAYLPNLIKQIENWGTDNFRHKTKVFLEGDKS